MGWNSWNTFTWDINEQLIRDVADRYEWFIRLKPGHRQSYQDWVRASRYS
ncbi:hypothetical protein GOM71_22005 [Paenibacillus sp. NEAU-GSW1]|nr:hypothetical protein [Paenibacillus sp. NEAU-GSW1]